MDQVKKLLFTAGLQKSEFETISSDIDRENVRRLKIFSIISLLFLVAMYLVSFLERSEVTKNRPAYLLSAILVFSVYVIATCTERRFWHILGVYIYLFVLFTLGAAMGLLITPEQKTVTFFVLLTAIPTLFNERPIWIILFIFGYAVFFTMMAVRVKTGIVLKSDLTNAFVYSILGAAMATYSCVTKSKKSFAEHELKRMSHMDIMTKLGNRYAHDLCIEQLRDSGQPFHVVQLDLNCLKTLNDTKGHAAGDALIRAAADCIERVFSAHGQCFRTGGDEFCVIIKRVDCDMEGLLDEFEHVISGWKGEYTDSLSVAYGWVSSAEFPEADVMQLLKIADLRMYERKQEFYQGRAGA